MLLAALVFYFVAVSGDDLPGWWRLVKGGSTYAECQEAARRLALGADAPPSEYVAPPDVSACFALEVEG